MNPNFVIAIGPALLLAMLIAGWFFGQMFGSVDYRFAMRNPLMAALVGLLLAVCLPFIIIHYYYRVVASALNESREDVFPHDEDAGED